MRNLSVLMLIESFRRPRCYRGNDRVGVAQYGGTSKTQAAADRYFETAAERAKAKTSGGRGGGPLSLAASLKSLVSASK